MDDLDRRFMRRALQLAERGRGWVEPNPLVGAVVVRDGRIVGEGWHQKFGGPHAEVHALDAAGAAARDATLYVTLEPCRHHGKTPPCTDRVLSSKVRRVVCAMGDPFPQVAGGGVQTLRDAGVDVDVGCLNEKARVQNAGYLKLLETGRPYVHAKWAMSLDGRIATRTGESKWISGEESRRHAHSFRGRMDAIVVGVGTAIADDPLLTARPAGPRTAVRVVLDASARLPTDGQLARTAAEAPVLVATTAEASGDAVERLRRSGVECLVLPADGNGRPLIASLLDELGRRRMTHVLVEGGSEVLGGFVEAGQVDAARVYVAGKIIGGRSSMGPVGGLGVAALADALNMETTAIERLGPDLFLEARRAPSPSRSEP